MAGRATALHRAALSANAAAVRQLLDEGADPTARDARGRTPLAVARDAGRCPATVAALVDGAAAAWRGPELPEEALVPSPAFVRAMH